MSTALSFAAGLLIFLPDVSMAQRAAPAQTPPLTPAQVQAESAAQARAAAALPDWSGVWAPNQPDVFDAKAGSKATRDHPPYTAEYEAKYLANIARLKTDRTADPISLCLPLGALRVMALAGRFEFVATLDMAFVFAGTPAGPNSTGVQTRRIYTDGRPQLSGDDLFPTYTGNAIGHWEGDTLVVHTVGLNDSNFVDRTGAVLSGDAVLSERIRLIGPNTLEDRITVTDPKALTRPWTVTRTWRRIPGAAIVDDSCAGKRVDPEALTDAGAAAKAQAQVQAR